MKLSPVETATILDCSADHVRQGMKLDRLNIGSAVPHPGGRWSYNIQSGALARHMNVDEEVIISQVMKMREEVA